MSQVAEKIDHAAENAKGWLSSINEMIANFDHAEKNGTEKDVDEYRRAIEESVLSVLIRDGWRQPGAAADDGAEEYEILLSTGGPALRIWGKLNEYEEPETAELQTQDWGTPWTRYPAPEAILLRFAQFFYFG